MGWRENQSFSQIVLHVLRCRFLKNQSFWSHFFRVFEGPLSVFGLLAGFRVNQKRSTSSKTRENWPKTSTKWPKMRAFWSEMRRNVTLFDHFFRTLCSNNRLKSQHFRRSATTISLLKAKSVSLKLNKIRPGRDSLPDANLTIHGIKGLGWPR